MAIPTELEAKILRYFHVEKWRVGIIARQLGVHYSTVDRVLSQAGLPKAQRPRRPSLLDPYLPFVIETLEQFPRLTASRLYAMVCARGYTGGPDQFRHLIAHYRPRLQPEAYHRLRTLPGEQGQVDWGLCDRTLIQYGPFYERFLSERFGQGPVEFAALQAGDVIEFVKQQAALLSPARAKAATTALRSFLRYLRYCGEIQLDLAAAVPTVPNWSLSGIPRAIAPAHLQAMFAHCPRNTLIERRDYAILMLLAQLGLRAGEIVSLSKAT